MSAKKAYGKLLEKYREIAILTQIENILDWDFETYMPPMGLTQRSQENSLVASLIHERKTDKKLGELIQEIKTDSQYDSFTEVEKRNVYLIEREFNKLIKVPKDIVEKLSKQKTITIQTWKRAKKEQDYSIFKPEFDKLLDLAKKRAHYLDPEKHPFDVVLDEYEPGLTSEQVSKLFNKLKEGLIPIIKRCTESPKQPDLSLIRKNCPIEIQRKLSNDIARFVNYDLERGSIDETEHPFTTGYYDDVRITTHYYEDDFADSFYSVLHEAGHGLYAQNLSRDYIYQPVGDAASYGVHESQSRFIENIIGRSREFWEYYMPRLRELTGDIFADVDLTSIVHALNYVKPSKIRITADEVTYCLHIIIRFEIERDLLMGKITTEELPKVWNAKYKEYLDVNIKNDSEGVMQDTHWASGLFGYFPSYAMGNIYKAQMLNSLVKEIPNFDDLLRKGELNPIINWLIEHVHKPAKLYNPPELIRRITGEEINIKYFIKYLEEKYSKIYGF
ncbi:MAG: carboxypeptidase M32 [Candidatus Hodarchaeota archaeon]